MANCINCGTEFSFIAALQSLTPWSIKCLGCNERIRSSILTFSITCMLYVAFCIFAFTYLSIFNLSMGTAIIVVLVVGMAMEIVWFLLLKTGVVRSNLTR